MFFSNDESKTDDYFKKKRREMVEFQLRSRDIDDVRVWNAMGEVPREAFVPKLVEQQAYGDGPLSIGCGQTISQPYVVAFMAQELKLNGEEKVLEVGAGSGYGAAVLSRLASEVHTVERLGELAEDARERLTRLGYRNVTVHHSDGSLGLEEFSPYDGIVVTAGARHLPQPYVHQLAEGGRIVIPIGSSTRSQQIFRYTKQGAELLEENLGSFAFVPLIGEESWDELEN